MSSPEQEKEYNKRVQAAFGSQDYSFQWSSYAAHIYRTRKVNLIMNQIEKTDERILDIGCADGVHTAAFSTAGHDVVGIDFSKLILKAKRVDENSPQYVAASAAALPFDNGSFGVVISMSTLMYVIRPKEMMREVFRVLGEGGSLVLDVSNARCLYYGSLGRIIRIVFPSLPCLIEPEARKYKTEDFRTLVESVGFRVRQARYLLLPHRKFPKWLAFLIKSIAPFLEHGPAKRWAGIIVLFAEKPRTSVVASFRPPSD